jgi:hypothetical protein
MTNVMWRYTRCFACHITLGPNRVTLCHFCRCEVHVGCCLLTDTTPTNVFSSWNLDKWAYVCMDCTKGDA